MITRFNNYNIDLLFSEGKIPLTLVNSEQTSKLTMNYDNYDIINFEDFLDVSGCFTQLRAIQVRERNNPNNNTIFLYYQMKKVLEEDTSIIGEKYLINNEDLHYIGYIKVDKDFKLEYLQNLIKKINKNEDTEILDENFFNFTYNSFADNNDMHLNLERTIKIADIVTKIKGNIPISQKNYEPTETINNIEISKNGFFYFLGELYQIYLINDILYLYDVFNKIKYSAKKQIIQNQETYNIKFENKQLKYEPLNNGAINEINIYSKHIKFKDVHMKKNNSNNEQSQNIGDLWSILYIPFIKNNNIEICTFVALKQSDSQIENKSPSFYLSKNPKEIISPNFYEYFFNSNKSNSCLTTRGENLIFPTYQNKTGFSNNSNSGYQNYSYEYKIAESSNWPINTTKKSFLDKDDIMFSIDGIHFYHSTAEMIMKLSEQDFDNIRADILEPKDQKRQYGIINMLDIIKKVKAHSPFLNKNLTPDDLSQYDFYGLSANNSGIFNIGGDILFYGKNRITYTIINNFIKGFLPAENLNNKNLMIFAIKKNLDYKIISKVFKLKKLTDSTTELYISNLIFNEENLKNLQISLAPFNAKGYKIDLKKDNNDLYTGEFSLEKLEDFMSIYHKYKFEITPAHGHYKWFINKNEKNEIAEFKDEEILKEYYPTFDFSEALFQPVKSDSGFIGFGSYIYGKIPTIGDGWRNSQNIELNKDKIYIVKDHQSSQDIFKYNLQTNDLSSLIFPNGKYYDKQEINSVLKVEENSTFDIYRTYLTMLTIFYFNKQDYVMERNDLYPFKKIIYETTEFNNNKARMFLGQIIDTNNFVLANKIYKYVEETGQYVILDYGEQIYNKEKRFVKMNNSPKYEEVKFIYYYDNYDKIDYKFINNIDFNKTNLINTTKNQDFSTLLEIPHQINNKSINLYNNGLSGMTHLFLPKQLFILNNLTKKNIDNNQTIPIHKLLVNNSQPYNLTETGQTMLNNNIMANSEIHISPYSCNNWEINNLDELNKYDKIYYYENCFNNCDIKNINIEQNNKTFFQQDNIGLCFQGLNSLEKINNTNVYEQNKRIRLITKDFFKNNNYINNGILNITKLLEDPIFKDENLKQKVIEGYFLSTCSNLITGLSIGNTNFYKNEYHSDMLNFGQKGNIKILDFTSDFDPDDLKKDIIKVNNDKLDKIIFNCNFNSTAYPEYDNFTPKEIEIGPNATGPNINSVFWHKMGTKLQTLTFKEGNTDPFTSNFLGAMNTNKDLNIIYNLENLEIPSDSQHPMQLRYRNIQMSKVNNIKKISRLGESKYLDTLSIKSKFLNDISTIFPYNKIQSLTLLGKDILKNTEILPYIQKITYIDNNDQGDLNENFITSSIAKGVNNLKTITIPYSWFEKDTKLILKDNGEPTTLKYIAEKIITETGEEKINIKIDKNVYPVEGNKVVIDNKEYQISYQLIKPECFLTPYPININIVSDKKIDINEVKAIIQEKIDSNDRNFGNYSKFYFNNNPIDYEYHYKTRLSYEQRRYIDLGTYNYEDFEKYGNKLYNLEKAPLRDQETLTPNHRQQADLEAYTIKDLEDNDAKTTDNKLYNLDRNDPKKEGK